MAWAWWTAGAFLLIGWIVLTSHMKVLFGFTRLEGNDDMTLDLHGLYGSLKFRYTIPILKFKTWLKGIELKSEKVNKNEADLLQDQKQNITVDKIRQAFENAKPLIAHCFGFNSWLEGTLSKIRCTSVVWKTSIGIGDAPETAFVVGLLWSLKSSSLSYVFRRIRLDTQPRLQVMPAFNELQFTTEVQCRFEIRVGYALLAGIRLLLRIMKVKDGLRVWQKVLFRTEPSNT
ncbi:DUF2953 domain-containing protein [Paenibacillus sp. P26]|nr:DUF2953 domain-containing protein [Paenibacillus sp. P26]